MTTGLTEPVVTPGMTRLCLFPFTKLTTGKREDGLTWGSFCCSQSARRYRDGVLVKDAPLIEVWNFFKYKALRRALLTGVDLPPACVHCERYPEVAPDILALHVALTLHAREPRKETARMIDRLSPAKEAYAETLKNLGVAPIPYPDLPPEAGSTATDRALFPSSFTREFARLKERIAPQLAQRCIRRASIWGCAETGVAVAAILEACGVELVAVYDGYRTGSFFGRHIRKPSEGFEPGVPVIIASSRTRSDLKPVTETLERAGVPYFYCDGGDNDERPVSHFKNLHKGRRAFVVGNGPSLNQLDMGRLKGEIAFGSNRVFLGFPKWDVTFPYWSIEDRLVGEDVAAEWNGFRGPVKFVPRDMAHLVTDRTDLVWLDFARRPFGEEGPRINDGGPTFYWGGTVTYLLLQLAFYMGCDPIYLIGVDFSYVRPDHVVELEQKNKWLSTGDDPNHFTPEYFGAGRKWHDPNVERMGQAFLAARRWASSNGVRVFNATPGTKLDVFPKMDFEDCFG